jgi:hypothetical protein
LSSVSQSESAAIMRHDGLQPLADRGRTDGHDDCAVQLQHEPSQLLRPGPAALNKTGKCDAPISAADHIDLGVHRARYFVT